MTVVTARAGRMLTTSVLLGTVLALPGLAGVAGAQAAAAPTVAVAATSTQPLTPPGTATYSVTVSRSNVTGTFTATLSVGVGALPAGATWAFNPPVLSFASATNSMSSELRITVAAATAGGNYPFTVTADAANKGSASASSALSLRTGTELTVSATPTSAVTGQSVRLDAAVAPAVPGTPGTATGTVTFTLTPPTPASPVSLTAAVSGGSATTSTSTLASATYNLTASYSGDAVFNPATANGGTVAIAKASVSLSLSGTGTSELDTFSFTATAATVAPGTGTPTGTVQFSVGGVALGGPVALVGGSATSPPAALPVGTHTIAASYGGDAARLGASASLERVVEPRADVWLTFTRAPIAQEERDVVAAGQRFVYWATVSNAGPSAAEDVTLVPSLDPAIRGVRVCVYDATSAPCHISSDTHWTAWDGQPIVLGRIEAGAAAPLVKIYGNLDEGAALGSLVASSAAVSSSTGDPDPANNAASNTSAVTDEAYLVARASTASTAVAGRSQNFSVTARSGGPAGTTPLLSFTTDLGGPEVCILSATEACGAAGTWEPYTAPITVGELLPGDQVRYRVRGLVPASAEPGSSATLEAQLTAPNGNPSSATANATVVTRANLSVRLTAPTTVGAGKTVTYNATAANAGPSDARGVALVVSPAAGLTSIRHCVLTATQPCTAESAYSPLPASLDLSTLAPTQSVTVRVRAQAPAAGTDLVTSATVGGTTDDPVPSNNTATRSTTVT